jgi:GT2 family glycosyltransferase
MIENSIKVSVIIVNYKVEKELEDCIFSILKSKPKIKFEIIVVDNDVESKVEVLLNKKFPQVKYIKSAKNVGFGAGNNLGNKAASGEYLFFLNPDTIFKNNTIDVLYDFMKINPKSGMVAPLLFDPFGRVYPSQGSNKYDLISAIVTSSFVNKIFPNNPISRKFIHANWDKNEIEEFDVVPGTAFMISKKLFEKVGKFDEKYFLYFEEYDLAGRARKSGFKNYIIPSAKVMHIWEASTKNNKNIEKVFDDSRLYFFRKNYGQVFANIVNLVSKFGKYEFGLTAILATALFLGFYKIKELMVFIGDQGWFYLSARDMLLSHQIPLVGIASSHPWLHQGPMWTYILAFFLWLFKFNPVSGAYLSIVFGALSVLGIYVLGSALFSKRVGLIASLLYAASPLATYYMRLPYHTSPIPLLVIAFTFFIYKINKGEFNYLPLSILSLALLYNFEIATTVLWGVLIALLVYKYIKNNNILKQIFGKKTLLFSAISLVVPLLPMILYDIGNGFPQTFKFLAWIFYRIISLIGYNPQQAFSVSKISVMIEFLFTNFIKLIFISNGYITLFIFAFIIIWIAYIFFQKKINNAYSTILLMFFIPLMSVILNQVPSDAYLPMLFPITILLISICFDYVMSIRKMLIPVLIFITLIATGNIFYMIANNFSLNRGLNLYTLSNRMLISKQILNMARDRRYNLKGKGQGSEFSSFTMNYEYLTWWLGHGPSMKNEKVIIYISEFADRVRVESRNLQ